MVPQRRPKSPSLGFFCLLLPALAILLLAPLRASAQTPPANATAPLTYDIASVRPFDFSGNRFQMRIMNTLHSARFQASGVTFKMLLHLAYNLPEDQIEGGPRWIDTDLFEVDAKADTGADTLLKSMPDSEARQAKEAMLQALLADRFSLKVHRTEHTGSVSALVIAKDGPRLKPSAPPQDSAAAPQAKGFSVQVNQDTVTFHQTPIHFLVDFLSQETGQQIVDGTGLTGNYDFSLRFHRELPGSPSPSNSVDEDSPSLQDALPEQLGLKLVSQKGKVQALVIDQIARPSPN